jgi:hypothetical protein
MIVTMAGNKETVAVLQRMSDGIRSQSNTLRDVIPQLKEVTGIEDELLEVAADLFRCAVRLDRAVESIRDWNSRHNIPIP